MKLENIDQYVHTLFMLKKIKGELKRIAKKPDKTTQPQLPLCLQAGN